MPKELKSPDIRRSSDQKNIVAMAYPPPARLKRPAVCPDPRVVGYFTLSAASVDIGELPVSIRKRLPAGAVIGVSVLGRLAVDVKHQGKGLAALMVATAANMSFIQRPLGCVAMVVDAIDSKAVSFYEHLGFIKVPEGPRRPFLLRESLARYL